MRELKTLGTLGYWLLTFEVTLPFFDKAGASAKAYRDGPAKNAEKKTAERALSLERLAVGQEREMRDGYKS